MAIQKEIWMDTIVEGLFASNSFLSKAVDADEHVISGKTVHIPNAGAPSGVKKNRNSVPAGISKRVDTDLTFTLNEYTTDPVYIPNAETIELSYDKRESVMRQDKLVLHDAVALDFIHDWSPESQDRIIETTGEAVAAHTKDATGKRKAVTKEDVLALMTKFNGEDIPQEGRYLMLDAQMYAQLLNSLTAQENAAFLGSADVQKGILGQLYSFNVIMRSKVGRYTAGKARKSWDTTGAATDLAAALAWHEQYVCRAKGEVKTFENEGDPMYYGDIYSFLVRAGGRPMDKDGKGVIALVQGTVSEEPVSAKTEGQESQAATAGDGQE